MENRHGLVVDAELTRASGHAERLAALAMLDRLPTVGPMTLAADRGFDARDFVMELRERRVTPHIAQNTSGRRSAIDRRTTRHPGYGASQRIRKGIEVAFGWIKTIAGQARTKLRGLARVRWSLPSPLPLTTWCACHVCSRGAPDDAASRLSEGYRWPLADRQDGGLAGRQS